MSRNDHVIAVNDYEHRLMVAGLNGFRTDLLKDGRPTEDVDGLLLKVIDAPTRKQKRKADREAR